MIRTHSFIALLVLSALAAPRVQAQSHFTNCSSGVGNVFNATVIVAAESAPNIDGTSLAAGSEIAVFSSDPAYPDLCVGVITWQGSSTFITVWGDDDLKPGRDGLIAGELLHYRVWDSATDTELTGTSVSVSYTLGNGLYGNDEVFVLSELNVYAVQSVPITIAEGWNLLGVPVEVADFDYLNVFPNAVPGTLFGFDGTYFQPDPSDLDRGSGYWLRFSQAETVTLEGIDGGLGPITLSQGWNLISGLSCSVPLSSIEDPGGVMIEGTLFGFSGTYYQANTLEPGYSYWVRASAAGQVTPNCSASKTLAREQTPSLKLDQFSALHISDASGAEQTLYFDAKLGASAKLFYSLPPVSPSGSFDARFEGGYSVTEAAEAILHVQASHYPITIYATNLPVEENYQYEIREIRGNDEGTTYALKEGQRIEVSNAGVLKLSRTAGIPTKFTVDQNYPNPFNPTTTIQYSLPEAAQVRLEVYDVLGKQVAVLVSEQQEAGHHEVVWDGSYAASGVYFYMVQAGDSKAVKKMLLVK